MSITTDTRTVMTLDAGGTNFVFSAIQANKEIVSPVRLPSNAHDLTLCLETIITGFTHVQLQLKDKPVAISFAFPGPADYPAGIIGDLGNLPAFRGGVALGPMLEDHFRIPVFINNDGDLFAYGEAIAGLLPQVNHALEKAGSPKRYRNLFGITLGTGFGGGIVRDGQLYIGDNAAAGEVWVMRNKLNNRCFSEEGASIRAVQRTFAQEAGEEINPGLTPRDIFNIAEGSHPGNREAAIHAFEVLGEVVGDTLANVSTLLDGLIVIGGGLSGASSLFLPSLVREMNSTIETIEGQLLPRYECKAFNLENEKEWQLFLAGEARKVMVPGTERLVNYDPMKRTGVGLTRLGTSAAVSIGAYSFALNKL
ncbi:MAG: ROK family protein [Bacteroidetes bacterium]|nr:ROK family protein [Bacteroidota bacterium]